jgi:nucleoside-triphosphatase THEP1
VKNILIMNESKHASGEKLLNEIRNIINCPIGGYWIDIRRDEVNKEIRNFDLTSLYNGDKGNFFYKKDYATGLSILNIDVLNTKGVQFLQDSLNERDVLVFNEIGILESRAEKFTREVVRAFNSSKTVIALLKRVNCDYINYIANRKDVCIFNVSEDNEIYAKDNIIKLLKEWKVPIKN